MLSVKYHREIRSTAETELQLAIQKLLDGNPSVENPVTLARNLAKLCGERWAVKTDNSFTVWFYRRSEKLATSSPLASIAPTPREKARLTQYFRRQVEDAMFRDCCRRLAKIYTPKG